MPTPVMRNPRVAYQVFHPEFCPMNAGNIRFPAPKKRANSMSPIAINSFDDFFISSHFFI